MTGRLEKVTDHNGKIIGYDYDANGNTTSISYPDGSKVSYSHDNKKGDLVELKDWTGTVRMEYNEIGGLKKITDHNNQTVGYGQDANGNIISIAYPDGTTVTYSYDKNDRMVKVVDGENQVTNYTYDGIGNTLTIQQPGSTTSYAYNKNGQRIQTLYQMEDGTRLEDNLTYDAIGNILSSVKKGSSEELTEQVTYTYDALGQLLSYKKGEITESYLYDILGNMTEKKVNDSTQVTYQYNPLNQLISKMEHGITTRYQYDKRGNQTEEKRADTVVKQYTYDATNHLVLGRNVETGEKSEYTYNSLYIRVKNIQTLEQRYDSYESYGEGAEDENQQSAFRVKETNYVIDYLSDTNNELMSTETGYGTTRVVYGRGSERLSQKVSIFQETPKTIQTEIARENNGKTYFQSDRLGSVLFASNQEGEVLRYAPRDVWGNLQILVEDDIHCAGLENSFGFTNHTYDSVLDKYFAQARFYDGENARMISKDSYWNPQNNIYGDHAANNLLPDTNAIRQSMNQYVYALNNPVLYYDPSGYLTVCQYGSFGKEFRNEAIKITLNNTFRPLPKRISDAKEFLAGMNELLQKKPSAKQIRDALGQSFWDGLSGDLRFVFNHLDWYKMNKKLTDEQVEELAQRSARAYEEGVQIIMTVVMAVKAVKGKIKVTSEQKKQMKMDLQYFAEKGGKNTGKWNKGSFGNAKESLKAHFNKHGKEVGAKTPEQYLRKAEEFAKTAKKNSTKSKVSGTVEGVTRYKKNGKYIDLAPDGTLISFGKY